MKPLLVVCGSFLAATANPVTAGPNLEGLCVGVFDAQGQGALLSHHFRRDGEGLHATLNPFATAAVPVDRLTAFFIAVIFLTFMAIVAVIVMSLVKSNSVNGTRPQLAPDIERFVDDKFEEPERVKSSISCLSGFSGPSPEDPDRIRRCVLFLSKDDPDLLNGYIGDALRDRRDVIWWAE